MSQKFRLPGPGIRFLETIVRPNSKRKSEQSRNFLLLQFQLALGTVLHATPLVEALKDQVPDARIIVASSGLAAQVWDGNSHLHELLCVPSPLQDFWGSIRALRAANLFSGGAYTTLLTTGNERTKISLASVLAGPSLRIGFAVHEPLLDTPVQWDPQKSQIENNLRLLPLAVRKTASSPGGYEPKIYPAGSRNRAALLLPPRSGAIRIALATQTSITQRKTWREERWTEAAKTLRQLYGAELIFIGAQSESSAIHRLRSRIPFPTISVAGQTTIQELAAVLEECDLGIMLDTGPLHVGRAVQLPTVIIAPAWSPEHEWLPVGNPQFRILKKRSFPPPAPEDYVIDEVSVEDVVSAVEDLLKSAVPRFRADSSF